MKKRNRIKSIWVHLRLSYASGRDILYGISNYARRNEHWNIKLMPESIAKGILPFPTPDDADGIISSEPLPVEASSSSIPLVLIGAREKWLGRRMKSLAFVRNDDTAIGRFGAEFFRSLGKFRSFGFVPTNTPYYCSILRKEGFFSKLEKSGEKNAYQYSSSAIDGSTEDIKSLGEWLVQLPKPAAVMAVHDLRATHVLEAATRYRIKIPEQLAIIGVDNDELLCNFTSPQLTSISPDHVKEGELAASVLSSLFKHKNKLHTQTFLSSTKVMTERESTRYLSPATDLAEKAMSFIRHNALKGISSADVAKHLHVSRRLCDMRFRECHSTTMLSVILDIKFETLKRRLISSKTSIGKLTAACGFSCENHAKRLFKKRFGMSMREWRVLHKQTSSI